MAYDKDKIFPLILSEIESGLAIRNILKSDKFPNANTFFDWLKEDESKAKQYARSCEIRAEMKFEEIKEIADDDTGIYYFDESGNKKVDSGAIQRKRLQIDARKWQLSKEIPKKYGDKIDMTTDGEKITSNDIKIEIVKP